MTEPTKLDRSMKEKHSHDGFRIEILRPGLPLNNGDSGIGAIGRIDHARVIPGTVVPMHPHKDDEILTYVRSGRVLHTDSEGHREEIAPTRLMLMNSGRRFQHEERMLDEGDLQGLQIFIRPREQDLEPDVQFHDFGTSFAQNKWRLIAGPSSDAPLRFRADAWVHDTRLEAGHDVVLPLAPAKVVARLLYVFRGHAIVSGITLKDGEGLVLGADDHHVAAKVTTDPVLFTTDPSSTVYTGGMFSRNVGSEVVTERHG